MAQKTKRRKTDPDRLARLHRTGLRESHLDLADKLEQEASDTRIALGALRGQAEGQLRRASEKLIKYGGETPADVFQGVVGEARAADQNLLIAERLSRRAGRKEKTAHRLKVTHEPGPYDTGSPHSWVRDRIVALDPNLRSQWAYGGELGQVEARLNRHAKDVAAAVDRGSKYGRRIEAMLREQVRCADENMHRDAVKRLQGLDLRALGTDGGVSAASAGEGAAYVPPAVLLKAWAAYRTPYASFAGQCQPEPMPLFGLKVYVAHVTGGAEVTSQTEGAAVAEKAPVAALLKGSIVNKDGQVEVSQQFLDRAGPGIAGDQVLFQQLRGQIDSQVDEYAIEAALENAQVVTNAGATFAFGEATGSAGVGGFLNDIRKGRNLLATTAGTRLKATHMFLPSKFATFIEAWGTTIGGPVFAPALDDNRLPIRSDGDPYGEGFTGSLLSGLALFADDSIPDYGTTSNYQVMVARPDTVLVFRSEPVFYLWPETYANTLDASLGARQYTACVPRWPEGVASLTGAFYKASQFA